MNKEKYDLFVKKSRGLNKASKVFKIASPILALTGVISLYANTILNPSSSTLSAVGVAMTLIGGTAMITGLALNEEAREYSLKAKREQGNDVTKSFDHAENNL